jgi:hypothetical protein
MCLQRIPQVFRLPFIGPLDYAYHPRVYVACLNAPLSSILILPARPYGFHDRLLCFFRRMRMGFYGMTNVALPRSGAAVYSPDFGDHQMELLPTQPCADLRALLLSEFEFFSFPLFIRLPI